MSVNIKNAVNTAVVEAVTKAVVSPSTSAKFDDRKEIADEVIKSIGPIMAQLSNGQPIYQSQTFWGLVLLVLTRLLAHYGYAIPAEYHGQILDAMVAYGPYAAGVLIAWGRFFATKPLFSGWMGGSK